jgi:acetolactate synthase-1/2/3 large subunit
MALGDNEDSTECKAEPGRMKPAPQKYSDVMMDWLVELGYTHCFFVAGGNIAVVHEVAAGIAAEYFNESGAPGKAFAMVTAGPGLTNIVSAIAGAWLESRELLVIGGQVKSSDLATGGIRQRGIQEIDGRAIAQPICVRSERIERPISRDSFRELVAATYEGRKGPVFLEICLDAQGAPVDPTNLALPTVRTTVPESPDARSRAAAREVATLVRGSERPVLLLGGGVSRATARAVRSRLRAASVAVMTTWNGMDRVDASDPNFGGRPNTWGQRSANILIQQADLIVAVGTRLGLQQTGFNYQAFGPLARIVQVDVDQAELDKGHPHVEFPYCAEANVFLDELLDGELGDHQAWLSFVRDVRGALPVIEANERAAGYLDPFAFNQAISERCTSADVIVPCSSGGAFTTAMQAFDQKFGQVVITDKGLAAMGYGLSGAIGAAVAMPERRVVLFEGDGGFSQNLQELATVAVNALNIKIFIVSNEGYASIRMTQRNYFQGQYLGCDVKTGLGFPNWAALFAAYGLPLVELQPKSLDEPGFLDAFSRPGPMGFVVPIDPEQGYFPKITSRVTESGGMESAPLHLMTPDLPPDIERSVMPFLQQASKLVH